MGIGFLHFMRLLFYFCIFTITITQALVIMSKWEQSGNGSGQIKEDDEEHGHVSENQTWLSTDVE